MKCTPSRCRQLGNSSGWAAYPGKAYSLQIGIGRLRNYPDSHIRWVPGRSLNFGTGAYRSLQDGSEQAFLGKSKKVSRIKMQRTFAIGHSVPIGYFPDARCFAPDLHLRRFIREGEVFQALDVTLSALIILFYYIDILF